MNKPDILLLYKYNQWSSQKILEAASKVKQAQYLAPATFPHGGLRGTLVHALFAQWIWRMRWEGSSPTQRLQQEDFPTFESLQARWEEDENKLLVFLDGLTDERLISKFSYNSTDGKPHERILWQTMAHLINHSTQHKTEAAALLTDFGHSPGDIDLIVYLIETH